MANDFANLPTRAGINKLNSLGYKINELSPSMLGGVKWKDHFFLDINYSNKTADITVFQLDNLTQ